MYVKCVKISYETAEGKFQIGQAGKDGNGNLFRLVGVSNEGVNVWLHVMTLNQITGKYESRFFIPKEALEAVTLMQNLVETIGWKLDYTALKIPESTQNLIE